MGFDKFALSLARARATKSKKATFRAVICEMFSPVPKSLYNKTPNSKLPTVVLLERSGHIGCDNVRLHCLTSYICTHLLIVVSLSIRSNTLPTI